MYPVWPGERKRRNPSAIVGTLWPGTWVRVRVRVRLRLRLRLRVRVKVRVRVSGHALAGHLAPKRVLLGPRVRVRDRELTLRPSASSWVHALGLGLGS